MIINSNITSIPPSESDRLLFSWGFDLVKEYFSIAEQIPNTEKPIIELATGTGRMCSVLASLFPTVVTGDISLDDLPRAHQRVTKSTQDHLTYLQLDIEELPFRTNSIQTLVCLNTLHEVTSPQRCLNEMFRVMKPDGILVIGDFNVLGFETMQRLHETIYHNDHSRGTISLGKLYDELSQRFVSVHSFPTKLNTTFFATTKR